jgi:seryl-tRNA synthetase
MLDITLIREKPDWVKDQIRKLNDDAALARVDSLVELDRQRRTLLTESETIQAAKNWMTPLVMHWHSRLIKQLPLAITSRP